MTLSATTSATTATTSTFLRFGRPLLALAVLQLAACLTVNVYFPEAAIRDLSQQIESEVRREAGLVPTPSPVDPAGEATGGTDSAAATMPVAVSGATARATVPAALGRLVDLVASAVWTTPVYAQGVPEPTITNPAIRKIIASRSARLDELNRFKATGAIGESNRALVEVLDLDKVSDLRERAALQRLVKEENGDREKLFREIAAAENVELSQLDRIQETYAATMRQYARPGDMIQRPDGTWVAK